MTRALPEWTGANPDTPIPPRVRVRIFERYHGACQGCLRKIAAGDKWDCDHIVALVNGGEHRETNLRILCAWCHKKKTAQDVAIKSKTAKVRAKHLGIRKPSRFPGSRDSRWKKKMDGSVVLR